MTARLLLATHNRHKVEELRRILHGLPVELLSAADIDVPEVEETGETFVENALLKARTVFAATGVACVADDSGLEVDALGAEPGVRSARYAGAHGDDQANLDLVLARLRGAADRRARFVCAAALVTADGEWTTEGALEGEIVESPRGANGFGYDPVFQPTGRQETTAEMSPQDKDAISHRGQAFRELRPLVERLVATHP